MATVTRITKHTNGKILFYNGGTIVGQTTGVESVIVGDNIVATLDDDSTITFPVNTLEYVETWPGTGDYYSPHDPGSPAYTAILNEINRILNEDMPDKASQVDSPGPVGSTNLWAGKIYGAWGDGNVHDMLRNMQSNPVNATPTNIATNVARGAYFRLPEDFTFNKIRAFGVGLTTNVYRVAVYRTIDNARITPELVFSTAANQWVAIGNALNALIAADQLYFIAVSVNATGTTAGPHCLSGTTGRIPFQPTSWPGNLDINAATPALAPFAFGQFAVTTGALPDPAPAISGQAAWTGGMPAFFLDNSNA